MLTIIEQDIAAGNGITVIDPQGKLVKDILGMPTLLKRAEDVVLFDLGSDKFPIPLNPFCSQQKREDCQKDV